MILPINLHHLRNAEYVQFLKDFVAIAGRNNTSGLQFEAKHNDLKAKTSELDVLFVKIMASENTQVLQDLDIERDNAITGISTLVTAYSYHFDANLRTAAQKIMDNLKLYGSGIARLNYQAETATISSIVSDWETKPALNEALTVLNLQEWKEILKKANEKFNEVYLNRTQEYGNATPENLSAKRQEANGVYYALRDRINALHTLVETPPSPYLTVINELNALVTLYVNLISNRGSQTETTPENEVM